MKLFDVALDGTVLLGRGNRGSPHRGPVRRRSRSGGRDAQGELDGHWISDDGTAVTIADQATRTYSAYLEGRHRPCSAGLATAARRLGGRALAARDSAEWSPAAAFT